MDPRRGVIFYLGQYGWLRHVERRCGIWLRARDVMQGGYGPYYIRRPGVTPEAAAAALRSYTQGAGRPAARRILVLALLLAALVLIGGRLLSVWLSTQWISG